MTDHTTALLAGKRILIAEDELMITFLLEAMLDTLDARVVGSVRTLAEVIPAADFHAPDAVTLDINLHDTYAYDAAMALRERSIPFVLVTGYDELPDCPHELLDAPRLKKPFQIEELRLTLRRTLGIDKTD